MSLTARQRRCILIIAFRKSRDLYKIRRLLILTYPEVAKHKDLDDEIRDTLDECNVDFVDYNATQVGPEDD